MPREIDVTDILVFINRCTDLSSLASINVAVGVRRSQLGVSMAPAAPTAYRIGQIVRMNNRIRPAYLRGLTVTIVGINRTTVSVRVPADPAYGRFSGAHRVRLPISLIAGVVTFPPRRGTTPVPGNNGEDDGLSGEREALTIEGRHR